MKSQIAGKGEGELREAWTCERLSDVSHWVTERRSSGEHFASAFAQNSIRSFTSVLKL